MDAENTTLIELLKKDIQFEIPIYQRTYDWARPQIRQLYEDIIRAGTGNLEQHHFIGAITCVTLKKSIRDDVERFQLIDGQQRITSVMLLLRALKDVCGENTSFDERFVDKLLFNTNEIKNSVHYHKMRLFDEDDRSFRNIMDGGHATNLGDGGMEANFEYFKKRLEKEDPVHVWFGIKSLSVVLIKLQEQDDPQAIFESMNSTGLDLTYSDMIQNYMLMRNEPDWQKRIYGQYWHPMEQQLNELGDGEFDKFLRSYTVMKCEMFVSEKNVYQKFKEYMKDNVDKEREMKDIHKYSKYYAEIRGLSRKFRGVLKEIQNIRDQCTDIANPLLMKILADMDAGVITAEDAKAILQLLDAYLLRSYVSDTIKGANKYLPKMISKIDPVTYVDSIKKYLVGHANYPSDAKFKDHLGRIPLYRNKAVCKYMLGRLEQGKNKLKVDLDHLQIEHIMPQDPMEWKDDLGSGWREIHEKYIHTIGNLTLTENNQAMSNSRFLAKKSIYGNSQIQMTKKLSEYVEWGEKEIKSRAEDLANKAFRLWPYPEGCDQSVSEDDSVESEYLENTNVSDLWYALKDKILKISPKMKFHMTVRYGAFTLSTDDRAKVLVCSIRSLKDKIYLRYNTKIKDEIIKPSTLVRDMSGVRYGVPGELQSVIKYEENIDEVVKMVSRLYRSKKQQV